MKNSIKKLLAAGAVCFVVLLLMSLFRVEIITPGLHLLMAQADERLGLHLTVGSIEGTLFSNLEFRDVRAIAKNTEAPVREIICPRIIFHYPLQALWSGFDSLLSHTEVEVDGLHLDVDLKVFSEGTAKQNSTLYRLFALPAILPKIRVNDGTLSLSSTEYTAFVDGISLQVEQNGRSGPGQSVQLIARSVAYSAPQQRAEYTDITSSFSYSAAEVCLDSLLVEGVQHIRKSCLDLTGLSREQLAWNLDINIFDGQLNMLGGLEGRDLQLQLSGQELDLGSIAALAGSGVPMNGRLAINSEFQFNLDAPADLSASLEINGSDGMIGGIAFEEMELAASLSEQQVSVQRFAVHSGDESVAIDNASFPFTALLDGNGRELLALGTGAFTLQIDDLVPWLEAAKIGFPEQMRMHPVALTGQGEMRQGSVELAQLALQFDENRMTLAAAHIPAAFFGSGEGQRWQGITGDFGLRCANIPALMGLYNDHLPLLPMKEPDHLLELNGRLHSDAIVFSAGSLQSESVLVELERGSITFPADGATLEKMTTDISLKVKIDALDRLAALFNYRDMSGALRGSLELKGPLEAPAGEFVLVGDHLVWSGLELGDMQARGSAADGWFTLEEIEIKHASDYVHGRVIINVAKRKIEELTINLSVAEMAKYGSLLPENLQLGGRATASLVASGPLFEPQTEGNILLENAMINKVQLNRAALSLSGSGRSLRIHSSAGLAGEEGAGANLAGTLSWNPDRSRIAFSLDSMTVQRQAAGFELVQPADFSYEPGKRITVKGFLLQGRSGSIAADGFWVWSGDSNLSIRTAGLSGKDWFDALVSDRFFFDDATVRADIGGDWAAPRVTVLGSVGALAGRNAPFSFQGDMDFSIARQTIDIRKFDWQGVDNQGSVHIKGRIPWDQQKDNPLQGEDLFLESQFDLPELAAISSLLPEEAPVSGSLHGALLLRGSWQKPTGSLQLIGSRLSIPVITRLGSSALFDLNCQLSAQKEGLVMKNLRLESSELSMDVSGSLQAPLSLEDLLQDDFSYFTETLLAGNGRLSIGDVSWLAGSSAAVHRLAGRFDLRTALAGTIKNPEIKGTVELSGGELRTSYAIPTIRSLNMVANIDPQQIVIQSLQGELGGAPFSMTGVIDKYLFGKTQLALSFSGKNLLFYRDAGMKFRGDALLKVNGPLDHLGLTGEVLLTDGHYLRNVDFFSSFRGTANPESAIDLGGITFREPPLSKADLNIRIGAARVVRIKNNVFDGAVRPDLVLMGTGESPYLVGNVYLDPTKIKLPAGQIKVKSGLIRFTEADPERPEIDLAGESRIMGYEISAQANGFLFEPVITLSSSPPLPEDELLLLLLTGKAPKSDSGAVRTGSGRMAMYIGRNILTQWFGTGFVESDESVLERFELEIGRGVSRLGEETIEAQFRVTDSLFNEDDILFITAEKDMYDSFNSGVRLVFRFQ